MSNNRNNSLYDLLIMDCCSKCNYFQNAFGICGAEVLPIEQAILNNLDGRGLCKDIKDYVKKIKE